MATARKVKPKSFPHKGGTAARQTSNGKDGLTGKQRVFLAELAADEKKNQTEAARKAGYANPEVTGSQLLNPELYPKVAAAWEATLVKVENASLLSAQDLLRRMHAIITFNPVKWFTPSDNPRMPGFMLAAEEFKALPDDVGELVQEAVFRKKEKHDLNGNVVGTETYVYFKLMSKDEALKTAAKFQLGERHLLTPAAPVDPAYFEQMHGKYPVGALPAHDPVEARLREAEAAADAATNRNPTITVRANGTHKNGSAK